MIIELTAVGLSVEQQKPIKVFYQNRMVGEYFADLLIDGKVILALKAVETIHYSHETQLQNYLRATEIEVGLLLNFGHKPEMKRKVFSNSRKLL